MKTLILIIKWQKILLTLFNYILIIEITHEIQITTYIIDGHLEVLSFYKSWKSEFFPEVQAIGLILVQGTAKMVWLRKCSRFWQSLIRYYQWRFKWNATTFEVTGNWIYQEFQVIKIPLDALSQGQETISLVVLKVFPFPGNSCKITADVDIQILLIDNLNISSKHQKKSKRRSAQIR